MKKFIQILPIIALCTQIIACDSNFVEKDPHGTGGVMVESDLLNISTKNNTINQKIEKIDEIAKKVKKVTTLIRKAHNKGDATDSNYTLIDFIIDANEELKSSIPEKASSDSSYIKVSSLMLKSDNISEECRKVDTKVEAIPDEANPEIGVITYSIKNCSTKGEFTTILKATWFENQIFVDSEGSAIQLILQNTALKTIAHNLNCKAENETKSDSISSIECENIDIKLSHTENAVLRMQYDKNNSIRFLADSKIMENGEVKANLTISVDDRGKTKVDLQKISQKTSQN